MVGVISLNFNLKSVSQYSISIVYWLKAGGSDTMPHIPVAFVGALRRSYVNIEKN